MSGRTGKVKFDEKGSRKEVNLEIMNLQNNSFRGVSILHCLTCLYGVLLRQQNCWRAKVYCVYIVGEKTRCLDCF